jgi:hypothetical protein
MRRVFIMAALLGVAFVLRLYKLDAVPLRGDEAFAVRYWAAPPLTVLHNLADWEPHPFGTFLGFWAWKSVAGGSEFAMRYLPLLGNLIGAAAVAALARRLFHDERTAYLAAFLWAINPFLIWHAQDVRNYALWASFSPLAMWLFLRAVDLNRPRDWVLYVLAELLALNAFFFEAFFLPVQALYLLMQRRSRAAIRRALFSWAVLAVLLIPWFVQIGFLSGSGYEGTTERSAPLRLFSWFLPTLLTGDRLALPWNVYLYLALGFSAVLLLVQGIRERWLLAWIAAPALFLLVTAARMSVFDPRYLIAVIPALLLLLARAVTLATPGRMRIAGIGLALIPVLGLSTLFTYYRGDHPKSGDWPALAAYLTSRARPGDLIVQTMADPAFGYYYHGGADETSLRPGETVSDQLVDTLVSYQTIWLIGRSSDAETYLSDHMQRVSFDTLRGFSMMQFRRWAPTPDEIETPTDITFGDLVRLRGYTLQGPDPSSRSITLLLYWEPLKQTDLNYKVFVHLIGPPHPDTPLWDQDDHFPQYGAASTQNWEIGALLRDPYHLLADPTLTLAPADYTIEIGLYDPTTDVRLPVSAPDDSYPLFTLHWPLR